MPSRMGEGPNSVFTHRNLDAFEDSVSSYLYDESGHVTNWGRPNINVFTANGWVDAWQVWKITVWWKRRSYPWHEKCTFYVERFSNIPQHYNNYFECGYGHTDRIVFVVECWMWPFEEGWEYKDYM